MFKSKKRNKNTKHFMAQSSIEQGEIIPNIYVSNVKIFNYIWNISTGLKERKEK